jgi:photosystem II stability/assembly factor-like uncharacterized protein
MNFLGIEVIDAQTAYVWGVHDSKSESVVLKTADGGDHWAAVLRVDQDDLQGLDFVDAWHGVALGEEGAIYATSDGGQTWSAEAGKGRLVRRWVGASAPKGDEIYSEFAAIYFANERIGWAGGVRGLMGPATVAGAAEGRNTNRGVARHGDVNANQQPAASEPRTRSVILRTADGGATWKECRIEGDPVTATITKFFFVDERNGWAVGGLAEIDEADVLLTTADGGATWKQVPTGIQQVFTGLFFTDTTNGWLVGKGKKDEHQVLATTDGGDTWNPVAHLSVPLRGIGFADAQTGWIVGGKASIYRTTDGGATWTRQEALDLSSGQAIAAPPALSVADKFGEADPFFSGFTLVTADRGWAASDEGIFEFK